MQIRSFKTEYSRNSLINDIYEMIAIEAEKNNMVLQDRKDIRQQIDSGDAVVIFQNGQVAAYACLEHWKNCLEVGALVVWPEYRKQGMGYEIVKQVIKLALRKYPEKKIIALPNNISKKVFEKNNFIYSEKNYFDDEIWGLCKNCKDYCNFPKCRCYAMIYDEAKIQIKQFNIQDNDIIKKVAKLYCNIWKEAPWNEDFWKINDVSDTIKKKLLFDQAVFIAGTYNDKIVAFCWGYLVCREELREITGHNKLDYLFAAADFLFYINEVGVQKEYRNRGIGKEITMKLIKICIEKNISRWCLRTHVLAQNAKKMYTSIGFEDLLVRDQKYPERTYWMLK